MIRNILNKIINFLIDILDIEINNKNNYYEKYDYSETTNYYANTKIKNNYVQKRFMTNCEKEFYLKILELENSFKIVPQINLAAIIEKIGENKFHNELFRNIDFAIFTKDYSKLLILIELNDSTHNKKERKKRDMKVNTICYQAGIRLITFYTKYPNTKEYVLNRIYEEINKVI